MTSEQKRLSEVVARVIDRHNDELELNPAWLATEALKEIDPERHGPDLEYLGCHLYLRQLARGMLSKRFDPVETPKDDLFPETLQDRYPRAHTADRDMPVYVLREHMTQADIAYNVARLRKEARAKLAHADSLEAWGRRRVA